MKGLTITSLQPVSFTVISNTIIDHYFVSAPGDFVKIYLFLMRCRQCGNAPKSLTEIAEQLQLKETDILRGLYYWEKQSLLQLVSSADGFISNITLTDPTSIQTTEEAAKNETAVSLEENTDLAEILLLAEQYLQRPLSSLDVEKLSYFMENLHFSPKLMEYLLEHCVTLGNKSIRYIESVAISWADKKIQTVEEAKAFGQHYRREYFTIIKAFGINNRTPIDSEVDYMKRWLDEYHFSVEVICEACKRTVAKTGSASFAYTEKILANWKEQGILMKKDIAIADQVHKEKVEKEKVLQKKTASKFNQFEQRSDYDFEQLEKHLNNT